MLALTSVFVEKRFVRYVKVVVLKMYQATPEIIDQKSIISNFFDKTQTNGIKDIRKDELTKDLTYPNFFIVFWISYENAKIDKISITMIIDQWIGFNFKISTKKIEK